MGSGVFRVDPNARCSLARLVLQCCAAALPPSSREAVRCKGCLCRCQAAPRQAWRLANFSRTDGLQESIGNSCICVMLDSLVKATCRSPLSRSSPTCWLRRLPEMSGHSDAKLANSETSQFKPRISNLQLREGCSCWGPCNQHPTVLNDKIPSKNGLVRDPPPISTRR